MNCPACNNQLAAMNVEGISVDVCKDGCGGIWFDNFELSQVDEKHESVGESLLQVEKNPDIAVDHTQKRLCPKCENQKMRKHFMSVKRQAEVDECPACAGIWLDAGELGQIRNQFETQADREQAADEYFSDVFGDQLATMRAESSAKLQIARNISKAFAVICPSFYIPGKQNWGAF